LVFVVHDVSAYIVYRKMEKESRSNLFTLRGTSEGSCNLGLFSVQTSRQEHSDRIRDCA
jgi:hypothetical protein